MGETEWAGDWQVRAAARVMGMLFAANNGFMGTRREGSARVDSGVLLSSSSSAPSASSSGGAVAKSAATTGPQQLLPTSHFYNLVLDYYDLIPDFKTWESSHQSKSTTKFAFCQYPFFLSMGTKIKILEHDAQRQMAAKARDICRQGQRIEID